MSEDLLLFPRGVSAELVGAVEALLFASGEPVAAVELAAALEVDVAGVEVALTALQERCLAPDRGVVLEEIGRGWQLRTAPRYAAAVARLRRARPQRLSRAALEVLAVVAYRQPVTRLEVEQIRGVDSGGVLKTLLERGLLGVAGRRDEPGRPMTYKTTDVFLELFSLAGLDALPTLEERKELEPG